MATISTGRRSISDVPDILPHIFSYLDPVNHFPHEYDQIYESRRSLALAARTCWGFAGPALDVLWKRLPDDQPLADLLCEVGIATREADEESLKLLGKDRPDRYRLPNQFAVMHSSRDGTFDIDLPTVGAVNAGAELPYERRWRLSRGYDVQYLLRDTGDPRTHPSWPRFVEYASRVHSITLFAFDGPACSAIWDVLRCRIDGAPILPRLRSVGFCGISARAFTPSALSLMSPSVYKLTFNDLRRGYRDAWSALDENQRRLFTQSFNFAPQIDQLRLEIPPSHLGLPLLQTHCFRIHQLEVYPTLTMDELQILTTLPSLQRLSIALVRERAPDTWLRLTFKTVTNLDVEGTWVKLSTFFDSVSLPSMHTLSVTGWAFGKPAPQLAEGAVRCFLTLSAQHASITSLSVCELPPLRRSPPPPTVILSRGETLLIRGVFEGSLLDLMHPLLSLSALRHLSLSLPTHYDLACTAADLRAVAEAFRALETLHLLIGRDPERPRGGSLDGLAHFARNCPRLGLLHLPAMEMTEESLTMVGDEGSVLPREPHGLRTLIIPKVLLPLGRADLAGEVSELVGRMFPLAGSVFRKERLEMKEDWVVVDGVSECPDPECAPTWRKICPIPELQAADFVHLL